MTAGRRLWLFGRIALCLALGPASGCSTGGDTAGSGLAVCVPGATTICTCERGDPGQKICGASGQGWGACQCGPVPAAIDREGNTNADRHNGLFLRTQVLDTAGNPIAGALVRAAGAELGATDARGMLEAFALPASPLTVLVSAPGYVDNAQRIDSAGTSDVALTARLLPVGQTTMVSGGQGGVAQHAGASAVIPPDAFVDGNGQPVKSPVQVEVTHVAAGPDLDGLGTFGITGQPDEMLQSLGAMVVRAYSSGQPVSLAPGAKITLQIPSQGVPPGATVPSPPLWVQNKSTGTWDKSQGGWDLQGGQWVAQIDALATWNCDFPSKVTCVRGVLVGPSDKPLSGVVVSGLISGAAASFLPSATVQKATTGSAGTFCMEVVPNASVDLSVTCPGGNKISLGTFVAPNLPGARCSGKQCAILGTQKACCFRDEDCDMAAGEKCDKGACESNACNTSQTAGGDTPESRDIELGKKSGTFTFTWDMYSIMDRMIVRYQGQTLFDTGCVSGGGSVDLSYSGQETFVTVDAQPNCAGDTGTSWEFSVGCPL